MKKLLTAVLLSGAFLLTLSAPTVSFAQAPEKKVHHKGKLKPNKKLKHHRKGHGKPKVAKKTTGD